VSDPDLLMDVTAAEIGAHFPVVAERIAQVGGCKLLIAFALPAPAIYRLARDSCKAVPRAKLAARLNVPAQRTVCAAFDANEPRRRHRLAGRRHDVNRPAQQRAAIAQRISALVDFGKARNRRIDHLRVAKAIGFVQRNAVLRNQRAAQVVGIADARTADRKARISAPFLLHVDPRHIAQHVGEAWCETVCVAFGRNHSHSARRFRKPLARFSDNWRIFGIARSRNDDSVAFLRPLKRTGLGEGRRSKGRRQHKSVRRRSGAQNT